MFAKGPVPQVPAPVGKAFHIEQDRVGVSILQPYPVKEGMTGAQTIEMLMKRVQTLGGQQTGQFLVDCDSYASTTHGAPGGSQPMGGGSTIGNRTLNILHNSDYPVSTFALLEVPIGTSVQNNPAGSAPLPPSTKIVPLVIDSLFDMLLVKMAPVYKCKQIKIESKGPRFELGDFVVKLGSVLMSQNFKGILIEVEYMPCVVPEQCWDLLMEFSQGILGQRATTSVPKNLQNKMKDTYTALDTMVQYMDQFTAFRKASGVRT